MAPETPSTPPSPPSCGQAVTPQSLGRAAAIGLAAAGAAYVVLSLVSSKMPAILRDLSNAFDAYSEVVELTTRAITGRAVLVASLSAAVSLLLSARSFYARPPDVASRRIVRLTCLRQGYGSAEARWLLTRAKAEAGHYVRQFSVSLRLCGS